MNVPIPRIRSTSSGSGTPSRVNCEFPLLPTWPPQSAAAATEEEEGSRCNGVAIANCNGGTGGGGGRPRPRPDVIFWEGQEETAV